MLIWKFLIVVHATLTRDTQLSDLNQVSKNSIMLNHSAHSRQFSSVSNFFKFCVNMTQRGRKRVQDAPGVLDNCSNSCLLIFFIFFICVDVGITFTFFYEIKPFHWNFLYRISNFHSDVVDVFVLCLRYVLLSKVLLWFFYILCGIILDIGFFQE